MTSTKLKVRSPTYSRASTPQRNLSLTPRTPKSKTRAVKQRAEVQPSQSWCHKPPPRFDTIASGNKQGLQEPTGSQDTPAEARVRHGAGAVLWDAVPAMPGTRPAPSEPPRAHKQDTRPGPAPGELLPSTFLSCNPKDKRCRPTLIRVGPCHCLTLAYEFLHPAAEKRGTYGPRLLPWFSPSPCLQPGPLLHCRAS